MRTPTILTVLILIVAVGLVAGCDRPQTVQATPRGGFSRVMATGELRCGYQYWESGLMKDDATGKLTGLMVEIAEQMATNTKLKIVWVGPIEWGNIPTELANGKIDAFCAGTWMDGRRSAFMLMTTPVAYNGLEAFVRGNDTRFDQNFTRLDRPDVRLAVLENTAVGNLSVRLLPHATPYALPASGTDMDALLTVGTGKADIAFDAPGIASSYMKNNPGQIKRLRPDHPYALMGTVLTVGADDFRLLHVLNTSLAELRNTGFLQAAIHRANERIPGAFVEDHAP